LPAKEAPDIYTALSTRAAERPGEGAAKNMASNDIVTLQDGTFEQEVLKSDVPVLVDFWAVWCGPCKAIAPTVEELAQQYKGKVKVAKLDVDQHQNVPQQYGIRSIPTLLMFKGGRVVDTLVGAVPKAKIEDAFKKVLT
jgi:thioredoxin